MLDTVLKTGSIPSASVNVITKAAELPAMPCQAVNSRKF